MAVIRERDQTVGTAAPAPGELITTMIFATIITDLEIEPLNAKVHAASTTNPNI